MTAVTEPKSLQWWLDEILAGPWTNARAMSLDALNAGGFATAGVTCTRHPGRPMTFLGAIGHLINTEKERVQRMARPDSMEARYSQLHQIGDFQAVTEQAAAAAPVVFGWETAHMPKCGALVIWALTPRGNRLPVDAEPSPRGTVVLVPQDTDRVLPPLANVLHTEADRAGVNPAHLYTVHFQTCTRPGAHDRGKSS